MSRKPEYCANRIYHFHNRGAHRLPLFREPDNYTFVLRKMKDCAATFHLGVIAYCLLPDHYHFLIRQDGNDPASFLPQRVFNSYSKAYNTSYEHSGTPFQGPHRVAVVTDEAHLLHLCRYIHANPVTHRLVDDPSDWAYSNYREWIGVRPGTLVDIGFVRDHFPSPELYREFVQDYLADRHEPQALKHYLQQSGN